MNRSSSSTSEVHVSVPPSISSELVEHLQKVFPNSLPINRNISDRDLGVLWGQQDIITYLVGHLKEQESTAIVST